MARKANPVDFATIMIGFITIFVVFFLMPFLRWLYETILKLYVTTTTFLAINIRGIILIFILSLVVYAYHLRRKLIEGRTPKNQPKPKEEIRPSVSPTKSSRWEEYLRYLKSPQWDRKRRAKLKSVDYECERCGISGVRLDVHHLHYETFGDEEMSDLLAVCRPCHEDLESKK